MFKHFHSFFCFLNFVIFVNGEGIYTVSAPGTIHPNYKYNVAISVHEANETCEFQVGIISSQYSVSKVIKVEPMSTKTIGFKLPKLHKDEYQLKVNGVSGIIFENSTHLNFEENEPWTIIQTDKPIYKPGDLIQFRVLFLNERMRPAQLMESISIEVSDSYYNTKKIWKNITLTQGVFTGKLQLSESSTYGRWLIQIKSNSFYTWKEFKVALYELPTFVVTIDTAHDVAQADGVIKVAVLSEYTFGRPVKGKATVVVSKRYGSKAKKIMAIAGKVHVEFDIENEIPHTNFLRDESYDITASVEEELTGIVQTANATIVIHLDNVIIEPINPPYTYYPGIPVIYIIALKKLDGSPLQDKQNPLKLEIAGLEYNSGIERLDLESVIDSNGLATFNFTLESTDYVKVSVSYLYKSKKLNNIGYQEIKTGDTPKIVYLNLKTKRPQLRKNVSIEVNWNEPINYFVYIVTGRGNILKVEHVNVPINTKSYTIEFSPTLEMIPNTAVFVQYIYDSNLRFEELTIEFEKDFQNTLEISTTLEASPGSDVKFNIRTDPNSFVGLLGMDQQMLLLKTGNDISEDDIFERISEFKTDTLRMRGKGRYPGKISGLVTLTNANYPYKLQMNREYSHVGFSTPRPSYKHRKDDNTVRIKFPETWIYDNFQIKNETSFSFKKQIPDTITSWIITGFSMNSKTGLALTNHPTKIQVFQPFFISVDLPYSVKQGEILKISVLIFNYLNMTLETEVSMDNSENEYGFFTETTNGAEAHAVNEIKQTKLITMSSNSAGNVTFSIKPRSIGITTVKVTAISALAGDSVHKKLKVEPEGVTQFQNRAFFININEGQEQKESVTIDIPANVVPHSEHLELSTIGDFVGLTLKNIDNLVHLPFGDGEQNMINFVPSILVLKYLKTIHQNMPNLTTKALNNVKIGFQRELEYKRNDGSFSAYGNSDGSGSTWLTAYVARSFQQASDFIKIDQELITNALDFLASKQTTNGNFAEFGHLLEFSHLNEVALTAFVLTAFLEDKNNTSKYGANIQKGVQYLIQNLENTEDIYSKSISAWVLQQAKHPLADDQLTKLKALGKHENGHTWWSSKQIKEKKQASSRFSSRDIEITEFILLAMLEQGPTEELLPIIKWLVMQRSSTGELIRIQDTVLGMQALIKFAEKTGIGRSGTMDIDFICEGPGVEEEGTLKIVPENSLVLMSHVLPRITRKVQLTAKGNGSSLVQLSYNYNIIDKKSHSSLRVNATVRKNTPPKELIIDICTGYVPSDTESEGNKTNIIVIEATLLSGFTISKEELDKLRDFKSILFTETKKSDSVAIIYLQSLEANEQKCVSIKAIRTYEVAKQKPAPIEVYDYIDKERRAIEFYEIGTSLCDVCQENDCKNDCKNQNENVGKK